MPPSSRVVTAMFSLVNRSVIRSLDRSEPEGDNAPWPKICDEEWESFRIWHACFEIDLVSLTSSVFPRKLYRAIILEYPWIDGCPSPLSLEIRISNIPSDRETEFSTLEVWQHNQRFGMFCGLESRQNFHFLKVGSPFFTKSDLNTLIAQTDLNIHKSFDKIRRLVNSIPKQTIRQRSLKWKPTEYPATPATPATPTAPEHLFHKYSMELYPIWYRIDAWQKNQATEPPSLIYPINPIDTSQNELTPQEPALVDSSMPTDDSRRQQILDQIKEHDAMEIRREIFLTALAYERGMKKHEP